MAMVSYGFEAEQERMGSSSIESTYLIATLTERSSQCFGMECLWGASLVFTVLLRVAEHDGQEE